MAINGGGLLLVDSFTAERYSLSHWLDAKETARLSIGIPCVNRLGRTPAKAFSLAGRCTQLLTALFTADPADLGSLLSCTVVNSLVTTTTIQQQHNLARRTQGSGAPAPRPIQEAQQPTKPRKTQPVNSTNSHMTSHSQPPQLLLC